MSQQPRQEAYKPPHKRGITIKTGMSVAGWAVLHNKSTMEHLGEFFCYEDAEAAVDEAHEREDVRSAFTVVGVAPSPQD